MKQRGIFNEAHGVEKFGFKGLKNVAYNLHAPELYEESIRRGEAVLVPGGAINAETGIHTGRSPSDKFTVRDASTYDAPTKPSEGIKETWVNGQSAYVFGPESEGGGATKNRAGRLVTRNVA